MPFEGSFQTQHETQKMRRFRVLLTCLRHACEASLGLIDSSPALLSMASVYRCQCCAHSARFWLVNSPATRSDLMFFSLAKLDRALWPNSGRDAKKVLPAAVREHVSVFQIWLMCTDWMRPERPLDSLTWPSWDSRSETLWAGSWAWLLSSSTFNFALGKATIL